MQGWVLIRVNFDTIQETEPKVGGGHSFARVRYLCYNVQSCTTCAVDSSCCGHNLLVFGFSSTT